MPKIKKLTPKEAHTIWKFLISAGYNVMYAMMLFWEAYQLDLATQADQDCLKDEMEQLKHEFDCFHNMFEQNY